MESEASILNWLTWARVIQGIAQTGLHYTVEEFNIERFEKLVGVYDPNRSGEMQFSHAYKRVFLCDLIGVEATTSNETSEVDWFSVDKIPQPFSGERTHQRHIDDLIAVYQNPQNETLFD